MADESISRDERRKLKLQMKREAKERMRQDFHEESGRKKIMLYAGIALAIIVVAGMDGALLLGCKFGDDYQCHFVKGSELADKRMANIGETLGSLGLEPERCAVRQIAINEYNKVDEIINEFVEAIIALGPNPFKGF